MHLFSVFCVNQLVQRGFLFRHSQNQQIQNHLSFSVIFFFFLRAASVALLRWKTSLDNHCQSFLSSWLVGSNYCNWTGIGSNQARRVTRINFTSYVLRGKLYDLNLSSLHHLHSLELFNNSLYWSIPSNTGNFWRLTHLNVPANRH